MDFYDELCQAIASDGTKRGVRTSPEEFQKFLSTIKPQPPQQPAQAVIPDRIPPMPQRELPPENHTVSVPPERLRLYCSVIPTQLPCLMIGKACVPWS